MNTSNHIKQKGLIDINLPPNFNMYAEDRVNQDNQVMFEEIPRLGGSNPLTFAQGKSEPINFEQKRMVKYNLDYVLNPNQANVENIDKELNFYREKV